MDSLMSAIFLDRKWVQVGASVTGADVSKMNRVGNLSSLGLKTNPLIKFKDDALSAIHCAILFERVDIVGQLINIGANPFKTTQKGVNVVELIQNAQIKKMVAEVKVKWDKEEAERLKKIAEEKALAEQKKKAQEAKRSAMAAKEAEAEAARLQKEEEEAEEAAMALAALEAEEAERELEEAEKAAEEAQRREEQLAREEEERLAVEAAEAEQALREWQERQDLEEKARAAAAELEEEKKRVDAEREKMRKDFADAMAQAADEKERLRLEQEKAQMDLEAMRIEGENLRKRQMSMAQEQMAKREREDAYKLALAQEEAEERIRVESERIRLQMKVEAAEKLRLAEEAALLEREQLLKQSEGQVSEKELEILRLRQAADALLKQSEGQMSEKELEIVRLKQALEAAKTSAVETQKVAALQAELDTKKLVVESEKHQKVAELEAQRVTLENEKRELIKLLETQKASVVMGQGRIRSMAEQTALATQQERIQLELEERERERLKALCPRCSAKFILGKKFCKSCGAKAPDEVANYVNPSVVEAKLSQTYGATFTPADPKALSAKLNQLGKKVAPDKKVTTVADVQEFLKEFNKALEVPLDDRELEVVLGGFKRSNGSSLKVLTPAQIAARCGGDQEIAQLLWEAFRDMKV